MTKTFRRLAHGPEKLSRMSPPVCCPKDRYPASPMLKHKNPPTSTDVVTTYFHSLVGWWRAEQKFVRLGGMAVISAVAQGTDGCMPYARLTGRVCNGPLLKFPFRSTVVEVLRHPRVSEAHTPSSTTYLPNVGALAPSLKRPTLRPAALDSRSAQARRVSSAVEDSPSLIPEEAFGCLFLVSPQVPLLHGLESVERRRRERDPEHDRPDLPEAAHPVPPNKRRVWEQTAVRSSRRRGGGGGG